MFDIVCMMSGTFADGQWAIIFKIPSEPAVILYVQCIDDLISIRSKIKLILYAGCELSKNELAIDLF